MMKKLVLSLLAVGMVGAVGAQAQAKGKGAYKAAKKECLAENPALKGKELQECIKTKNHK